MAALFSAVDMVMVPQPAHWQAGLSVALLFGVVSYRMFRKHTAPIDITNMRSSAGGLWHPWGTTRLPLLWQLHAARGSALARLDLAERAEGDRQAAAALVLKLAENIDNPEQRRAFLAYADVVATTAD